MGPTVVASKIYYFFDYILKRLLAIMGAVVFVRLLLKFFGANTTSYIVAKWYVVSDVIIWPFQGIFSNIEWEGHIIDVVGACAIAGYAILIFIILQILRGVTRQ